MNYELRGFHEFTMKYACNIGSMRAKSYFFAEKIKGKN